jgi:CUB domain
MACQQNLCIILLLVEGCNVTIRSSTQSSKNGTFHSPNWPNAYASNLRCVYNFVGLPHERVSVRFLDFSVKGSPPRWACRNLYALFASSHLDQCSSNLVSETASGTRFVNVEGGMGVITVGTHSIEHDGATMFALSTLRLMAVALVYSTRII